MSRTTSHAAADPAPTPGEKLFREGRDAMDRKELALACAKFAESYKLEHVLTSLLNQADCEEKRGRLATSLALWQTGVQKADDTTKPYAQKRAAALLPRVPNLTVHVGAKTLKEVVVTIDGGPIGLDSPQPIDPGDHVLDAKASGTPPETDKVTLEEGTNREITVLANAPSAPDVAPVVTPHTDLRSNAKANRMKVAGYAVGAVGLAGLGVFAVTGIVVLADHGSCPHFTCSKDQRPNALLGVNVVGLAVGVVGVAVGIPLVVIGTKNANQTTDAHPQDAPKAELDVGPTMGGAMGSFHGSF
jgi:hypothetical protein